MLSKKCYIIEDKESCGKTRYVRGNDIGLMEKMDKLSTKMINRFLQC